jgi:hypothetical protein
LNTDITKKNINDSIDQLEVMMGEGEIIDCPLIHRFADGMYIREIFMPKSIPPKITLITSMVHNTTHPYFILQGKVAVISDNDGEQILEAGYAGITIPNTRRALRIIEDCRWVTCHSTNIKPKDDSEESLMEAVRLIEKDILLPYNNPLLDGHYKNNEFIPSSNDNNELVDINKLRYD